MALEIFPNGVKIHDVEQNSEAWDRLRLGIPTASTFGDVLAKGKGITRSKLMRRLAGEIITEEPHESFRNKEMDRGHRLEDVLAKSYAFLTQVEPQIVGFVTNGQKGASPDRLIGDDGVLEIKSQKPELLIETFEKNTFPSEHYTQCQGVLWVTERDWCDIAVGWPGMALFVKRTYRDTRFIVELSSEVSRFQDELAKMVERVRAYGLPVGGIS